MDAAAAAPRLYLDAVLAPRPSLPVKGFALLMAVFGGINVALGMVFWSMGAVLVPVFLGLDMAALSAAFLINYRRVLKRERVRVSADAITVERENGRRRTAVWRSATAFTAVEVIDPGRHRAKVVLRCMGRSETLGAALAPCERTAFAERLQAAVRAARAERW